jgi:protein TonB
VATDVLPLPGQLVSVSLRPPDLPPEPPQPVPPARTQPPAAATNVAAPVTAPPDIVPERPVRLPTDLSAVDAGPAVSSHVFGDVDGRVAVVAPPPPPLVAPREPVRVGGSVTAPAKVYDVAPAYPPVALASRIEGVSILQATISVDGRVVEAQVLRPAPLFDQAALDAVRQWRYTPTHLNGVPVAVVMTVTVSFRLR